MIIKADNLGHYYGRRHHDPTWLYKNLTFTLPKNSITVVLGPNGSGKTTLLKQIVGLKRPIEGQIVVDGVPISQLPITTRAQTIAYLPQTTPLYYNLFVGDLVMLGRTPHIKRFAGPTEQDRKIVDVSLKLVGLQNFSTRPIFSLSGGEYQRVMIARMLATQASILVLDEPTTSLDIRQCQDVLGLCKQLATQGRTVVLSLHDLTLARRFADFALCLGDSQNIVHTGTIEQVVTPEIIEAVFGVRITTSQHETELTV